MRLHWWCLASASVAGAPMACGGPDSAFIHTVADGGHAGLGMGGSTQEPPSFGIECSSEVDKPKALCPSPTRLAPGERTTFPQIVFTGAEYGVVFIASARASHEVRFARLDTEGTLLGTTVVASGPLVNATPPVLAWDGTQFGVVWVDGRDGNAELYFARLDAAGTLLGSELRLTNAPLLSIHPAMVASNHGFAVAWQDERAGLGRNEIYFTRIDPSGTEIDDEVTITAPDGIISQEPTLAWTGSNYGIAWYDTRDGGDYEAYFARLSPAGEKLGQDVRLTESAGVSDSPDLLARPDGFALCWSDKREQNMEIYCGELTLDGAWVGTPERITITSGSSLFPDLSQTKDGLAVAWDDNTCGSYDIYFTLLTNEARKVGDTDAVTFEGAAHASFIDDGKGLALAWHDFRYESEEVLVCLLPR